MTRRGRGRSRVAGRRGRWRRRKARAATSGVVKRAKVSRSTASTGRGRVSEQIIVVAPKEKPVTVVLPKYMTVVAAATGTQRALVLARNSLELETIMQNVIADNSRDQYDTRAVGLVLWLYKDPSY